MDDFDVAIVGSGPAGCATALHLSSIVPRRSNNGIILIEKHSHPREKLCGGALSHLALHQLKRLGLCWKEIPSFSVRNSVFRMGNRCLIVNGDPAGAIIRRNEFDAWLANQCKARGVLLLQNEELLDAKRERGWVGLQTTNQKFRARVVVGADGVSSVVRRKLVPRIDGMHRKEKSVCRLLEILTRSRDVGSTFSRNGMLVDFTPCLEGIPGYYWRFPSYINETPYLNRGIFDSRFFASGKQQTLKKCFEKELRGRGVRNSECDQLEGGVLRCFDPHQMFSWDNALLVGDAAGADPFIGEGISFALAYGEVAAKEISEAFLKKNFSFSTYRSRVMQNPVLTQLRARTRFASLFYRRHPIVLRQSWKLLEFAAPFLFLQEQLLGLHPYPTRVSRVRIDDLLNSDLTSPHSDGRFLQEILRISDW